jgi:hypothetical protein
MDISTDFGVLAASYVDALGERAIPWLRDCEQRARAADDAFSAALWQRVAEAADRLAPG